MAGPVDEAAWVPIYCEVCEMFVNGSDQYEDHLIGKKHRLCTERAKKIEAGIRASVLRTGAIACRVCHPCSGATPLRASGSQQPP